jgi:2-polyprenyl-3-methyl-5-hydroxy-6-metoxy-1,4-benzoquinol methylase
VSFDAEYAGLYDLFYAAKDSAGECDLLESLFAEGTRSVLDLGCGTGRHALELARRGYRVTGVDGSASMLEHARAAASERRLEITWKQQDLRQLDGVGTHDAAIVMFAVLGYLEHPGSAREVLTRIRRAVRPGGTLVFDCWFGPGVLRHGPSTVVHSHATGDGRVLRIANPVMDLESHAVDVAYEVLVLRGHAVAKRFVETHRMRFYFPRELRSMLREAGFDSVQLRSWAAPDRPVAIDDWNVLVIAR